MAGARRSSQPGRRSAGARRGVQPFVLVALTALVIAVGAVVLVARGTITPSRPTTAGPGQFFPSQGHCHIGDSCPKPDSQYATFTYASDPPTSGPHLEQFIPRLVSDQPLAKPVLVHLLEHGNVGILYSDRASSDLIARLQAVALADDQSAPSENAVIGMLEQGHAVFVAPYPGMAHAIALVAWTRLDTFDAFDQDRIDRFVRAWLANAENARQ